MMYLPIIYYNLFYVICNAYKFSINSPYDSVVWNGNQNAVVKFALNTDSGSPADDAKVCVDLMHGDPNNAVKVKSISCDLSCSDTQVSWQVPDYPADGGYFVRVGTPQSSAYSHKFTIQGGGTVPLPKAASIIVPQNTASSNSDITNDDTSNSNSNSNSTSATFTKSTKSNGYTLVRPIGLSVIIVSYVIMF